MLKSKMRLLSVSALAGVGLIASGTASAYDLKIGGVDVRISTTMSVGATWQMDDSDSKFLPEVNGGPAEVDPSLKFVRDGGELVFYDPTILDTAGDPAYQSKSVTVRQTAVLGTASESAANALGKPTLDLAGFLANPQTACGPADMVYGGECQSFPVALGYNYDGAINTDDGRLNFDKGDAVSAPLKLVSDVEFDIGPVSAFFRVKAFHDAVLMDSDFNRGGELSDAGEDLVGGSIDLLDAFVSYDFDLANMPVTVRAGKQVINWGEATFIPGGNSAFNPIDVPAIRRPGAEIKEALLPVEALYGSVALTDSLSVEAYYGGWERYRLDVGGTFFAGSDTAEPGHTGGNALNKFLVGGGYFSGTQWICDKSAHATALPESGALVAAIDGAQSADICDNHAAADMLVPYTVGLAEAQRELIDPNNAIDLLPDEEGDEAIGIAVRWYAENLNSTEFGFYYQKTDSRLPYVSYRTTPTTVAPSVVGWNGSQVARGAGLTGCATNLLVGAGAWLAATTDDDPKTVAADTDFSFSSPWYGTGTDSDPDLTVPNNPISDPDNLITAFGNAVVSDWGNGDVTGVASNLATAAYAFSGKVSNQVIEGAILAAINSASGAGATTPVSFVVGQLDAARYGTNSAAQNKEQYGTAEVYSDLTALLTAKDTLANTGLPNGTFAQLSANLTSAIQGATYGDAPAGTVAGMQQANCAAAFAQANSQGTLASQSAGHPFDSFGQLQAGSVLLGYDYALGLYLEHPEVETYGMSFNTVLNGWGVQGDFTYRPDAPLQIDTDELTVRSLFLNCGAVGAGGAEAGYMALSGYNAEFGGNAKGACYANSQDVKGYVEHDVYTWDIGTTATFTRSNPIINLIGADLGILLTEFQGLYADGAEDRAAGVPTAQKVPLSSVCTSGSDLPLGSILNIDAREAMECRPTDSSSGMVLLARAQYNNVFGTPIGLSPTVVYREGLDGYSPTPLGSWREGVGSTALSMGFSYLGSIEGSVNYVTYHGDDLRTKNKDREHLSVSLSYAF